MKEDPIVAEVRLARDRIAARFNYDLEAIAQDAKQREQASRNRKFAIGKDGVLQEVTELSLAET
ncbi:MAG: hypothetical protein AAB676_12030 [Verrucomicrobiota bacterium]